MLEVKMAKSLSLALGFTGVVYGGICLMKNISINPMWAISVGVLGFTLNKRL